MGQRVNIILAVEDSEGIKKVTVYHDQWGIGRKCPLNIMSLHHAIYNGCSHEGSSTDLINLDPKRSDLFAEYELNYDADGVQNGNDEVHSPFSDFMDPASVGAFIDELCDNNNGAMVIHVQETVDNFVRSYDMKVGFLLGHEDEYFTDDSGKEWNKKNRKFGKAFSRWLTLEEWCGLPINDRADKKFTKIVKSYMEYFNIGSF
jgi:hypothetical protein